MTNVCIYNKKGCGHTGVQHVPALFSQNGGEEEKNMSIPSSSEETLHVKPPCLIFRRFYVARFTSCVVFRVGPNRVSKSNFDALARRPQRTLSHVWQVYNTPFPRMPVLFGNGERLQTPSGVSMPHMDKSRLRPVDISRATIFAVGVSLVSEGNRLQGSPRVPSVVCHPACFIYTATL